MMIKRTKANVLEELREHRETILARLVDRNEKLEVYDFLQRSLAITNVATAHQFQEKYQEYYRLVIDREDDRCKRDQNWRRFYFSLLESEKGNRDVSFRTILEKLYRYNERCIEASFSSKIVATIRPELPVYDQYVAKNIGLDKPSCRDRLDRLEKWVDLYDHLQRVVFEMQTYAAFTELKTCFDERLPSYKHFTDVKKLDLFLWQHREGLQHGR